MDKELFENLDEESRIEYILEDNRIKTRLNKIMHTTTIIAGLLGIIALFSISLDYKIGTLIVLILVLFALIISNTMNYIIGNRVFKNLKQKYERRVKQ